MINELQDAGLPLDVASRLANEGVPIAYRVRFLKRVNKITRRRVVKDQGDDHVLQECYDAIDYLAARS